MADQPQQGADDTAGNSIGGCLRNHHSGKLVGT